MRGRLAGRFAWYAYLGRRSGAAGRVAVVLFVGSAAVMALVPWGLGRLTAALMAPGHERVWTALMVLVGLLIAGAVLDLVSARLLQLGTSRLLVALHSDAADEMMAPTMLSRTERLEECRAIQADLGRWEVTDGFDNAMTVLFFRGAALGSLVVLLTWNPLVALLVAVGQVALGEAGVAWLRSLGAASMRERDEADYWRGVLVRDETFRELRLFGLAPEAMRRFRSHWQAFARDSADVMAGSARPIHVASVVAVVLYAVAFLVLVHDGVSGAITPGVVVTMFGSLLNLSGFGMIGNSVLVGGYCEQCVLRLRRLAAARACEVAQASAGAVLAAAVRLRGVHFSYPGCDCPVFDGLDLDLEPGSVTALVGVNGSGKSTLVRLIAGVERPDAGTIEVGGCSDDRDRAVSVVFQEFTRFPLDVAENVTLADEPFIADQAGLEADVASRTREEGEPLALSGGEWQRVALARCVHHAQARGGLVIFDEPTSALDPIAEREIMARFRALTAGLTVLLVTHRLGSVTDADRIVVLEAGQVVEDGTHEDLMRQGGAYAGLFDTQRAALLSPVQAREE